VIDERDDTGEVDKAVACRHSRRRQSSDKPLVPIES
jgi:hypothetical protein